MPFREIADVIARHRNVPVLSKSPQEAAQPFGWLRTSLVSTVLPQARKPRNSLDGAPGMLGLIPDLDGEHYFEHIANAASMRR